MVMAAVVVLAGGVTFAALQSQATLTDNTIASATADLQVDNTDNGATPNSNTDTGFAFTGVVPGGAGSNIGHFILKNNGTGASVNLSVKLAAAPTWTTVPVSAAVDETMVHVIFTRDGGSPQDVKLSDLVAGNVPLTGGPLAPTTNSTFSVQIKMDADAFSGSSASASAFQFVFTGAGA
jgi:hypothetical protein